jgi:hypothetical protein
MKLTGCSIALAVVMVEIIAYGYVIMVSIKDFLLTFTFLSVLMIIVLIVLMYEFITIIIREQAKV